MLVFEGSEGYGFVKDEIFEKVGAGKIFESNADGI